jgi:hypothetical protein
VKDFMNDLQANDGPWTMVRLLLLLCGLAVLASALDAGSAAGPPDDHRLQDGTTWWLPMVFGAQPVNESPIYGVNFVSSPEDPADDQQYQNGLSSGATFNRWPMYWHSIEQKAGVFDWSRVDPVVSSDLGKGLGINAILLGTPGIYATELASFRDAGRDERRGPYRLTAAQAATPVGLHSPVFSDGSDVPGFGKTINPDNVWARFVFRSVERYRPGGVLAQLERWPAGRGIRHWEIWNEPDLPWFWDSSLDDYARLLKVGYLAVKQADPAAYVLFGALANNFEWLSYYDEVLAIYDHDPLAPAHDYYHDVLATHSYFYAWQSWLHVYRALGTMEDHGLDKPVWLNENGVPAWDDYPGPVWDPSSPLRATMEEQANYIIQSAFYAAFAGADAIFHFQLYDGCGNQPQGSDFPPHGGALCGVLDVCAGDAHGLFRNPTDAACFTQHPAPETARPNLVAFQVLTTHLTDIEPLWRLRPGGSDPYNGPQEWIAFYRKASDERIVGLWARFGDDEVAELEAVSGEALAVYPDGSREKIYPDGGSYRIRLPGATNQNAPWDPTLYPIGGRPVIVVERVGLTNSRP